MDKSEFFDHFKEVVKNTLSVVLYSSNELQVRCPFCGDSAKNPRSAHLYISNKYPFAFNCFRCPAAGRYLTYELINKLNIYDADVRVFTKKLAKESFASVGSINRKKVITDLTSRTRLIIPPITKIDTPKLQYLNDRLGRKISKPDIERYKLVFSLIDFLEVNNIKEYTADLSTIEFIDEFFFGSLSLDETNLTFRNITESVTNRYRLYSLYNITNKSKTFSVRKDLDLFADRFRIVITEGVIDLMQIEHLFYDDDTLSSPNYISTTVNGNTISHVVNEILSLGIFPADIDIYIDNEYKSFEKITKDLNRLRIRKSSYFKINVFTTNDPKLKTAKQDFGVPIDQIKLVKLNV